MMRKILSGVVVALMIPVTVATAAAAAPPPEVDVCHHDAETETYHRISVSSRSAHAHEAHGDGVPGGDVPGMDGAVFDEGCGIVEASLAEAGCFGNVNGSVYFATDGTNPQMTPGSTPYYSDPDCTQYLGSINSIRAFVWDVDVDAARLTCIDDLGGGSTGGTQHPNLFLCINPPPSASA